jgi:hypothetical protein
MSTSGTKKEATIRQEYRLVVFCVDVRCVELNDCAVFEEMLSNVKEAMKRFANFVFATPRLQTLVNFVALLSLHKRGEVRIIIRNEIIALSEGSYAL